MLQYYAVCIKSKSTNYDDEYTVSTSWSIGCIIVENECWNVIEQYALNAYTHNTLYLMFHISWEGTVEMCILEFELALHYGGE